MATNYKVLGQSNPAATTLTTLYTVPAATQVAVSSIHVANLNGAAATVRIAIRPAGAAIANQHYVAYDVSVPANGIFALTEGFTLGATDVVSVYASTATVAFNISGAEIS